MNADTNELLALLSQFLPSLPLFLVWLGAGGYALVTWRRHPMVSLLTLSAVVLQAATTLLGTLAFWYLAHPRNQAEWQLSNAQFGLRLAVLGLVRTCLSTLAYVLLFVALFGWRTSPTVRFPTPPEEEPP